MMMVVDFFEAIPLHSWNGAAKAVHTTTHTTNKERRVFMSHRLSS